MVARTKAVEAHDAAVSFLLDSQYDDGSWRDYRLDVGEGTSWVTAYVLCQLGIALNELPQPDISRGVDRAVQFLGRTQSSTGGWGYNEQVVPDCDTTAYAVLALSLHRGSCPFSALEFVRAHHLGGGWFATFRHRGPEHPWCWRHPDVSAVALLALRNRLLARSFLQAIYLDSQQFGRVAAFWWEDDAYVVCVLSRMAEALGLSTRARFLKRTLEQRPCSSVFGCALLGFAASVFGQRSYSEGHLKHLLDAQLPDGSWPSSAGLRYVSAESGDTWRAERRTLGEVHLDHNRQFTTATVTGFLRHYMERCGGRHR